MHWKKFHLLIIITATTQTNEAFIAIYKIPGYLYNAALNFNKTKDWEKSIEVLENIINNYNDSEYFDDASYILFNTYIDKATELASNLKYVESVEEFLKTLDLEVQNNSYNKIPDYKKEECIPQYTTQYP